MIISKRTVGPELQSEARSEATYLQGGRGPGRGKAFGIIAWPGRSGLREAKEMIISKRTVGPEHLRNRRDFSFDLTCKGGGVQGGGKGSAPFPDRRLADYGKRRR